MVRDDVPNETQRSVVLAFMQHGQDDVLAPYVEKYLEVAETLWEEKGTQRASTALEFLFPRPLASPRAPRPGGHLAAATPRPTRPPSATCARAPPTWSATCAGQAKDAGER